MSHYSFQKLVYILLALILFAACSVEHKIAKSYVKKENKGAVLVLSPDTVFALNARDTAMSTSSVNGTQFLKLVNRNALIRISLNHLKKRLTQMGFKVFDESSINEYLRESDSSYVLKLSQVELEEGIDYEALNDFRVSGKDTIGGLNYFSVNSWFQFGRKNILNEEFPILYCSISLNDQIIENYTSYDNNRPAFFTVEPLVIYDFYALPEYLGKTYASYFYDYVMNIFVLENLPSDYIPSFYFHYDSYYKIVYPLKDGGEHFIELEEEF